MATITTKYSIGDTVYLASTHVETKQHECPDCKGSRKWLATSPAGSEYSMPCPRCTTSYRSKGELALEYSAAVPTTRRLTIGSIKTDTANGAFGNDEPVSYMCKETGVGSGNVWRESLLFETEEAAYQAAELMAQAKNEQTPWIAKQFDKSLDISDYQLENAALKNADDLRRRAQSLLWNLNDLFDMIAEAGDLEEAQEAVSDYKRTWLEGDLRKATDTPDPEYTPRVFAGMGRAGS